MDKEHIGLFMVIVIVGIVAAIGMITSIGSTGYAARVPPSSPTPASSPRIECDTIGLPANVPHLVGREFCRTKGYDTCVQITAERITIDEFFPAGTSYRIPSTETTEYSTTCLMMLDSIVGAYTAPRAQNNHGTLYRTSSTHPRSVSCCRLR